MPFAEFDAPRIIFLGRTVIRVFREFSLSFHLFLSLDWTGVHYRYIQGWQMHAGRVCARTQTTGAAARESLWRDHSVGQTSPALHACGSASPFCAHFRHGSRKPYILHPSIHFLLLASELRRSMMAKAQQCRWVMTQVLKTRRSMPMACSVHPEVIYKR